jgi:hypothetical protein
MLLLLLILLLALLLRDHAIGKESLWFDEQASLLSAEGHMADWLATPLNRIFDSPNLTSVRTPGSWLDTWRSPDFHPPLYAVVLRVWRCIFAPNSDEFALRFLSVLASLAAIVCLFDLGCSLASTSAALWACAIMAVAQPQIQMAQEARGYTLWLALALGASAAAARLAKRGISVPRLLALGLCSLGMLLTHFLALGSLLALAVWCAFYFRGKTLRAGIWVALLVVVIFLCSGVAARAYENHQDALWMREPPQGHVRATLSRFLLLPARFLADPMPSARPAAMFAAILYLVPWPLCRRNPVMLWCGLWLCIGTALVCLLDLFTGTQGLYYIRFTFVAAPAMYLLIAALPLRSFLKHLLPASALACCLISLPDAYGAAYKGEWRALGHDVPNVVVNHVLVFASSQNSFLVDPLKLYLGVSCYYNGKTPFRALLLDRPADAATLNELQSTTHLIYVVTDESTQPPTGYLPGWNFVPLGPNRLFAGRVWQGSRLRR